MLRRLPVLPVYFAYICARNNQKTYLMVSAGQIRKAIIRLIIKDRKEANSPSAIPPVLALKSYHSRLPEFFKSSSHIRRFFLFAILAVSLWLRLHQIGQDPFWYDEIGVVRTAEAANLVDAVAMTRYHVAAMPMDYVVAWLAAKAFGFSEGILRLPSAVWGVFSVLAAYGLFSKIGGHKAGLLTALFLAFSPLHIRYSQELRFYSALVFFYLVSNLLFLLALEKPTHRRWLAFSLTALAGILFHAFVALTYVNAFFWVIIKIKDNQIRPNTLFKFAFYSFTTLLFAYAAVKVFAYPNQYVYALFAYTPLLQGIGAGLGWLPLYSDPDHLGQIGCGLLLALALVGIVHSLRRHPGSKTSALFLSAILQMILVLTADAWQRYFFYDRQLIFLLPVSLFFSASGLAAIIDGGFHPTVKGKPSDPGERSGARWISLLYPVLVLIYMFTSLATIKAYHASDRSYAPQICGSLQHHWREGYRVYIYPKEDTLSFEYYLAKQHARPEIIASIEKATWAMIEEIEPREEILLITYVGLAPEQEAQLFRLGFKPVSVPEVNQPVNYLWLHAGAERGDSGVELLKPN